MGFRRLITAALVAVAASTFAVAAAPQPAAADGPVFLELLWIRCQDSTGEPFSDEIWVDMNGVPAGLFLDFDATELRHFQQSGVFRPTYQFTGDSVLLQVWEKDQTASYPGDWDPQGIFLINRDLANTGEHEAYAFLDGEYIVRYRVYSG